MTREECIAPHHHPMERSSGKEIIHVCCFSLSAKWVRNFSLSSCMALAFLYVCYACLYIFAMMKERNFASRSAAHSWKKNPVQHILSLYGMLNICMILHNVCASIAAKRDKLCAEIICILRERLCTYIQQYKSRKSITGRCMEFVVRRKACTERTLHYPFVRCKKNHVLWASHLVIVYNF